MKYYNYQITFSEIPDEVTLCINLTDCPIHCADCHSKFLWKDTGVELTKEEIYRIIDENQGVSCVCLMGGDGDYNSLHTLFSYIEAWMIERKKYLKLALYSGRIDMQDLVNRAGAWVGNLQYVKVGPYVKSLGGLNNRDTNQRLYMMNVNGEMLAAKDSVLGDIITVRGFDITSKFWK